MRTGITFVTKRKSGRHSLENGMSGLGFTVGSVANAVAGLWRSMKRWNVPGFWDMCSLYTALSFCVTNSGVSAEEKVRMLEKKRPLVDSMMMMMSPFVS